MASRYIKHPKTALLLLLLLIFCSLTFGCSTNGQVKKSVSQEPEFEPLEKIDERQTNQSVERLSSQQTATIETSQGTLEIEPTVVSATDAAVAAKNNQPKQFEGDYYDPLESMNRAIFKFNHGVYSYFLIPVAKGYDFIVPDSAKDNVDNVFSNLREPLNFVNNALSFEGKAASRNLGRFLLNSTIGVLGIFDVAEQWFDIKPSYKSVGDLLTSYSVGDGAYLVLPVFGPSDIKSAASTITEGVLHPVNLTIPSPESTAIMATNGVHDFTYQVELYETLRAQAKDPYIYFRNQHIQAKNRDELAQQEQKGQWFKREESKD